MVLLHFLLPVAKILALPWRLLGIIPLALGVGINLIADKAFKGRNTTVKPLEKSTALITTGVFRLSRHPMYLGFFLVLLGIAALMGSLTPFGVVLVFAVFIDAVFMTHEERDLEATFGERWLAYKARVRRWI